jgi:hypothetical protein
VQEEKSTTFTWIDAPSISGIVTLEVIEALRPARELYPILQRRGGHVSNLIFAQREGILTF